MIDEDEDWRRAQEEGPNMALTVVPTTQRQLMA